MTQTKMSRSSFHLAPSDLFHYLYNFFMFQLKSHIKYSKNGYKAIVTKVALTNGLVV